MYSTISATCHFFYELRASGCCFVAEIITGARGQVRVIGLGCFKTDNSYLSTSACENHIPGMNQYRRHFPGYLIKLRLHFVLKIKKCVNRNCLRAVPIFLKLLIVGSSASSHLNLGILRFSIDICRWFSTFSINTIACF